MKHLQRHSNTANDVQPPLQPGAFRIRPSRIVEPDNSLDHEDDESTDLGQEDHISNNNAVLTATIVDEEHERELIDQQIQIERQTLERQIIIERQLLQQQIQIEQAQEASRQLPLVHAEVVNTRAKRPGLIFLSMIVVISIVVAVRWKAWRRRQNALSTSTSPINNDQVQAIVDFVNQITLSNQTDLSYPIMTELNAATGEQRALDWFLRNEDPLLERDIAYAVQRFAIVVLAFSLGAPWPIEKDFKECELLGVICDDANELVVRELNMGLSGLEGSIPNDIALLTSLRQIDFMDNALSGSVPWDLMMSRMTALTYLTIERNLLSGSLPYPKPDTWPELKVFMIQSNRFQGTISPNLVHWSRLEALFLDQNRLSGTIPTEIAKLSNLTALSVRANDLEGPIPSEIGQLTNLYGLEIGNNPRMSGSIPTELGQLYLIAFDCAGNHLTGSLPTGIEQWVDANLFDIHDNSFTGTILSGIGNWSSVITFDISNNDFTGTLPAGISQWTFLYEFDISNTSLSGQLPEDLRNWANLQYGYFGGSAVHGSLESLCLVIELAESRIVANCSNLACTCCECVD